MSLCGIVCVLCRDDFNIQVLHAFLELHEFTDLNLVQALRQFLWSFRLPGEAQKIDRMMEAFARRYCRCNPGVFQSTGTPDHKREVHIVCILTTYFMKCSDLIIKTHQTLSMPVCPKCLFRSGRTFVFCCLLSRSLSYQNSK